MEVFLGRQSIYSYHNLHLVNICFFCLVNISVSNKLSFPCKRILEEAENTTKHIQYNSIEYLLENRIDIAIVENNLNPKLNYTTLFKE
jgi:hypothetical protein